MTRFPGWAVRIARSERELVAVPQQYATCKNLGPGARPRRARHCQVIVDLDCAYVYAAITQNADRRGFSIPNGLYAFLIFHGQQDLSMRIAPRHGLDDAADFDSLARIEDTRLTVMRVSKAHEHVETQDQAYEPHESSHVVISCCPILRRDSTINRSKTVE